MRHPFHAYIRQQLEDRLKKHSVVVFYDPRREFTPFIDELRDMGSASEGIDQVNLGSLPTSLVRYQGSFFAIRALIEPLVAVDLPEPLLIYVPGVERDRRSSVL